MNPIVVKALGTLLACALLARGGHALAQGGYPYSGMKIVASKQPFESLVGRLEKSIAASGMGLVAQASASRAAAGRGIKIPGNAVLMVFPTDYAVRMLKASVPAGIEAPLRLYVTENPDGSASVIYRLPTAVFAPYGSPELDAMAKELDPIFEKIVRDSVGS